MYHVIMKLSIATVDGRELDTFLSRFIQKKIALDDAETGTPFSRDKTIAIFIMLYDMNLQTIADTVGVAYGTVRNWKSEPAVKDKLASLSIEFAIDLIDHIIPKVEEHHRQLDLYADAKLDSLPLQEWPELEDSKFYSQHILNTIRMLVYYKLKDDYASTNPLLGYSILEVIELKVLLHSLSNGDKQNIIENSRQFTTDMSQKVIESCISEARNILKNPRPTKKERHSISMTLELLEEHIKNLEIQLEKNKN